MVRRTQALRPENRQALALAEIDRLKALLTRLTDGRKIVFIAGDEQSESNIPPVATSEHVLYGSKHTRAFLVTAAEGVSLIIHYQQGQAWIDGTFYTIAAGTLLMTDAATNYVFIDNTGVITSNTASFPNNCIPLAEVVTAGGTITSVADRRSYLAGGVHVGGILWGNPLEVGTDDTDQGTIILYGDGTGSAEGGEGRFYLAADHDTAFEYWRIDAYEDDLRFGRSDGGVAPLVIEADRDVVMAAGELQLGVNDTTRGTLELYGPGTGNARGGTLHLYMAADHDSVAQSWQVEAYQDDILFRCTSVKGRLTYEGQWQVPIVGSGAGFLAGGDAHLYRYAANVFAVGAGDAIVILGGAGDFGTPVNGMLWYNTTSNKLRGYEGGAWGDLIGGGGGTPCDLSAYVVTNVTTDRTYDADATSIDELADVLGTLIDDLDGCIGGGGGGAPTDAAYIVAAADGTLSAEIVKAYMGDNLDPDVYPAAPDALDDEFENAALDGKWTIVNDPGGGDAVSESRYAGFLAVGLAELGTDNFDNLVRVYQTPPTGTQTWTIIAKVALAAIGQATNKGEWASAIIYIGDSANDAFMGSAIEINDNDPDIASRAQGIRALAGALGTMSSVDAQRITPSEFVYLRLDKETANAYDASNDYTAYVSRNGIIWWEVGSETKTFTTACDEIGLAFRRPKAQTGTPHAESIVDFFRRTA